MAGLFDLYKEKAGAGKPVSASKVSGVGNTEKPKTLSQMAIEQAAGGYRQSGTPTATKPKTISELYAEQAAKAPAYTVPAYTQPEDPIDAALRRQKEIAEQYARAEREYKAAQADMQMMAMSGGLVSADAAAREQAAREAYQRAQAEYTQSREKAPDERQSWREAAQRQREAQAELELAAMSGGYAGADAAQRAVQATQEREDARQAYLTQRNQNIAQGDGTNAARGRDSLFRGAYDLADNRESSLPGSEYAALMGREDFAALSQAGESKLSWNPFRNDVLYDYINDINGARQVQDAQTMAEGGRSYAKYALMTDQEIAVYNYLYASGGKKAADAFLKDLEPELDKQWYSGVSRQVTDWAEKNEATKAVASAATVAGKPVRDLTSLLATGEDAIRAATGQGINPYSELRTASRMTQDIRGAVSQDMGEVGQFAYNTAMSAADSAVGSFVASGIAQGFGAADVTKATATISSALMSSEVASLATAEAKEKGYSDLGALGLGLFRGAVEFASEKIGGEWVIRNMKKDPLNFMKTMVMNFIPEGTEEVMSDAANEAANLFIDWIFDTDESMIRQTYRYFSEKGTAEQKADPWLWTAMAMLKQEGLAFLGGGFATVGSTGAQYMNMQQSFRSAAEQLHTDNQTVAQLMEELGAEDPAVVAGMAEISKAESVEDFRAKMQTLDLAAEEADAAMQGKKGKKEKAREPRTLGDLAKAWMEKYPDGSVPAPFAGMEDAVMANNETGDVLPGKSADGIINDINTSEEGGTEYGQRGESGDREQRWNAGVGTGEQAGDNEGRASGRRVDAGHEEGQRNYAFEDLVRERITPEELGIKNGSTTVALEILDQAKFTEGTPEANAAKRARAEGLEPVFIRGQIQIGDGEKAKQARAYIIGNKVILQADGDINADQLLDHELYHKEARNNKKLNKTIRRYLKRSMTADEISNLLAKYVKAYDGIYDYANMTPTQIARACEEELFADLYASMDSVGRENLRETVRKEYDASREKSGRGGIFRGQRGSSGVPEGKALAAGKNAKTADSRTLSQAEQMERAGATNEEIRQATGWYKGRDGQWRFEIDDSGASFNPRADARFRREHPDYARYQELMGKLLDGWLDQSEFSELRELDTIWKTKAAEIAYSAQNGEATLGDVMEHDALYAAYPDIAETKVVFGETKEGVRGVFNPKTNTITLSENLKNDPDRLILTMLHEVQHRIQEKEGFTGGSSPQYWNRGDNYERGIQTVKDNRQRLLHQLSAEDRALYEEYRALDKQMEDLLDQQLTAITHGGDLDIIGQVEDLEKRSDELYRQLYEKDWYSRMSLYDRMLDVPAVAITELYQNTAGEIEARDAANRRNLTAEERKKTPPDLGDENTVFADATESFYVNDSDTEYDFGVTQKDISDYIDAAYEQANKAEYRKWAEAEPRLIAEVQTEIPDIEEYTHAIRDNDIRHVRNSHGETTKEKYPVTKNDQKLIPFIVKKFDKVIVKYRNGKPGLVYVKVIGANNVYYLESVTDEYNGEKLLVNKQLIKTGIDDIPNMKGLKDAIIKKQALADFLADLNEIHKAYARSANQDSTVSNDSILDSSEKSNPENEVWASAEVPPGEAGEQTGKGYTVREGVGKLFADQLDRLTEMADRQGIYYDGVQERLTDALVNAESEEDLDRRLAGMDSVRFAYSPELTEKLWELRELIQVDGERKQRGSSSPAAPQNDRKTKGETVQQEFDRLRAELDEPGHDAEYYQSRGRRLNELMEQGAKPAGSEQEERIAAPPAEARNDREEDKGRHRGPIGKDGIRTVKAEDAAEELMDIGEARVKNDAGTFLLSVRRKSDTNYLARVDHNGKLAASKSFETAEEAAAYAQSWVEGRTQGQEDAELDLEKSEPKEPQNALEQLLDPEAYQKEIARQKKNKAAQAATQTLRERIRRAQSELNALRRLEKSTGLTEAQKKHKADVQETLDIMNDELTSRKGRRQAKKEKAKATGNKPTRSAAEAKNALMDLFHTPAGERIDTGRAIEQKLTEIFESGKLTDEGRQELFDLLMEKGETVKHAEQLYEAIRRDLKGTRIYVSEEDRKGYGDNWDDLRRRAWAAGIYLTNNINDKGADVHNLEFSEVYGERTFPTDIAAQDMLENMIDLAEKGRPTKRSLREALEEEARQERMDPEEVFGDMWNRMEETLRSYAEKAGLEVDLKNRTASQLADERQRWQERLDKRSQARRESEIRGKLLNGLKRLERVRNKTAPEIKSAIEEILRDIDTQARQITPSGLEDLQALQRAYLDARKAAGYENDENMGNWIPNPYVEKRLEALTKKHVNDMDLQEVIELGRTVAGLEHAIATHNQMIGEEWDSTIEQEANGVRDEVSAAKGAKPGFFQKWFMEEHLSPRRFLEMLGGWKDGSMKKLSRSLEDGQTRALDFQRRATQSFDPFLTKKENRKWLEKASGKKAVWEKYTVVDGVNEDGASFTEIELTPMMKISLYLHSRNMDNLRHIQTGGIVIPNKELYQQGKIADAYDRGERVKMNPETVRKIAGELSDIEKSFANHMIRVFDTISKDAINEVSMQLDGFERAGVENYMPIETDRNFIKSDVAGEARAQTVEGIGSIANERIHASNPVMLIDASDVLTRQIDKVSRYYGYAIPIRNFQAVNNYVFHEEGAPFSTSVKELMGKKWGAGAEQYITKMLQDLQSSGRSSDMTSRALSALRGHLAGATLAFNPAVAVSQTASYPGAAQAVGWDGLAAGLIGGKVDTKLIEKYTPLYWYRNQGNSTQELGDVMKEKSMEQKLPWVFNWIQKMDSATIRRLWKAAEYRVSKDTGLKPGSQADIDAGKDAYYKAVAEVFNRAVYDTQPNYTNMERAQILRSDSDLTRFLTMYKTVPLQYYGMMVEATGRLRAAAQSGDKAQIDKAQKYALDTFGGLLAANTVYVTIKALFKTFRKKDKDYRDEEGNITAGSYARQLGKDLIETYAGSIIGGSEALSAIQRLATGKKWTGPDMSSLSYLEEMWNAVGDITDAMGEEDPRKAAKAIKNSAETLAMGFGVPAKNMETYIMATVRRISPRIGMEYDNLFGGIQKSDLKSMDGDAVSMTAGLILSNRTGVDLGKAVSDELARLYSAGYAEAVPTGTPDSFTYNGNTVAINDRTKYGDTWGTVVGDNLEELLASEHYQGASDKDKAKMVNRLYEYATVQARKGADPAYSADGNSTYGWTVKADEAVAAGIPLPETICALNAFAGMTADKDEDGKTITGSKKAKVCDYIDELDLTVEQKDILYLMSGYKENSLPYTPWHGWTEDGSGTGSRKGKSSGKRSGSRSGGGRSRSRSGGRSSGNGAGPAVKLPDGTFTTSTGAYAGFDAAKLFGGSGKSNSKTDAIGDIVKIVDKHYNGNVLEAMLDGWQKAKVRTTVDFKL